MVNLTTADISDSAGAQAILDAVRKRRPWLKRLFADGAYDCTQLLDKALFREFPAGDRAQDRQGPLFHSAATLLGGGAHL